MASWPFRATCKTNGLSRISASGDLREDNRVGTDTKATFISPKAAIRRTVMAESAPKAHRRLITGHRNGKSVVLSDQRRPAYAFQTVSGFEHAYIWAATGIQEADPEAVERELPKSALPASGGPSKTSYSNDPLVTPLQFATH
jgi:hypothetical protein